jgi:hypothetical protein
MKETLGLVRCIIADLVGLPAAARAIRNGRTLPNIRVATLMPVQRGG